MGTYLVIIYSMVCLVDSLLSQCVRTIQRHNFTQIVAYRKFPTGSIAVIDDNGKYGVFNSNGGEFYSEKFKIPFDSIMCTYDFIDGSVKMFMRSISAYFTTDWDTNLNMYKYPVTKPEQALDKTYLLSYTPITPWLSLRIPYMGKTKARTDPLSQISVISHSTKSIASKRYSFLRYNPTSILTNALPARNRIWVMDHARGDLFTSSFMLFPYGVGRDGDPNAKNSGFLNSAFIMGTIPYQTSNNNIYITDGDSNLITLPRDTCTNSVEWNKYQTIESRCSPQYCQACLWITLDICTSCISGFVLTSNGECSIPCSDYLTSVNTCETQCPLETYRMPTATPKYCVTDIQCRKFGKYILGDRCITISCPPGTTQNLSNYCIPNYANTAPVIDIDTYIDSICPTGTFYFYHYRQCTPLSRLPTTGYKYTLPTSTSPGYIYCDNTQNYVFDLDSQRCLKVCGQLAGTHPTMGNFCASPTSCKSLGYFTDEISSLPTRRCVSQCPSTLYTHTSISACRKDKPVDVNLNHQQSKSAEVVGCSSESQEFDPSTGRCTRSALAIFGDIVVGIHTTSKLLTPILFLSPFPLSSSAPLHLVSHSFTKLLLFTYFSFDLSPHHTYSLRFYRVFRDSLAAILSPDTATANTRTLCTAGFDKLCALRVPDSFFPAAFLPILIALAELLLACTVLLVLHLLLRSRNRAPAGGVENGPGSPAGSGSPSVLESHRQTLAHRIRHRLPSALLLQRNLDFSFSLLLNAHVFVFPLLSLALLKSLALLLLLLSLATHLSSLLCNRGPGQLLAERWTQLLADTLEERHAVKVVKGLVVHDILLSVFVVTGTFVSPVQMYLWAGVELLLTVLLLKFRVFKDKLLHWRQIVLGFFFVSLSLYLAIIASVSIQFPSVYPTLFFAYLVVLSAEVGVMLTLWTRGVIQMVNNKRQTPNNKIKSAEKVELRSGIDTNSPSAPVKLVQKKLLGSKLDKRVSAGTGQSVCKSTGRSGQGHQPSVVRKLYRSPLLTI
jgi:hypothetical protein